MLEEPKITILKIADRNNYLLKSVDEIDFGKLISGSRSDAIGYVFAASCSPSISEVILNFDGCYLNKSGQLILDQDVNLLIGKDENLFEYAKLKKGEKYRIGDTLTPDRHSQPLYFAIMCDSFVQKGERIVRIGFSYEIP